MEYQNEDGYNRKKEDSRKLTNGSKYTNGGSNYNSNKENDYNGRNNEDSNYGNYGSTKKSNGYSNGYDLDDDVSSKRKTNKDQDNGWQSRNGDQDDDNKKRLLARVTHNPFSP